MTPRLVSIVMAVAMASVGWLSSWRPASGAPPSELTRLMHLAVADAAERAGVQEQAVVVREVHRAMVSVPLAGCRPGAASGAPLPGYEMLLLANNAIYVYDGAMDCIVLVPRDLGPYDWSSAEHTQGGKPKALQASAGQGGPRPETPHPSPVGNRAPSSSGKAGALAPEADSGGGENLAAHDSFYRLHLGYAPTPVAAAGIGLACATP